MNNRTFVFILINLYIYISNAYIIRSNIINRQCDIKPNKVLNILFHKNICNNDISYFDLFGFNHCYLKKQTIKKGIELWAYNTDKINLNFDYDLYKNNFINITIKYKDTGDKVAIAYRYCQTNLLNGNIYLNKNKCFYPDNFVCLLGNISLLFIFMLIIFFHIVFVITIILQLELDKYFEYIILIATTCILFSTLFYIIYQCNQCFPLKMTIAHEFGHILGFGHPDEHYYYNYNAEYNDCKITKILDSNYDIQSVMISKDIRNKMILTLNDKLGLYDLYPSCKYTDTIYSNFETFHKNNILFFTILMTYISIFPIISICIFIKSRVINNIRIYS